MFLDRWTARLLEGLVRDQKNDTKTKGWRRNTLWAACWTTKLNSEKRRKMLGLFRRDWNEIRLSLEPTILHCHPSLALLERCDCRSLVASKPTRPNKSPMLQGWQRWTSAWSSFHLLLMGQCDLGIGFAGDSCYYQTYCSSDIALCRGIVFCANYLLSWVVPKIHS